MTRVDEERIVSNEDPERKGWLVHYSHLDVQSEAFRELGGMSGGPVFAIDGVGRLQPELVGLISEYHPAYNAMRIARLDMMRADGSLDR